MQACSGDHTPALLRMWCAPLNGGDLSSPFGGTPHVVHWVHPLRQDVQRKVLASIRRSGAASAKSQHWWICCPDAEGGGRSPLPGVPQQQPQPQPWHRQMSMTVTSPQFVARFPGRAEGSPRPVGPRAWSPSPSVVRTGAPSVRPTPRADGRAARPPAHRDRFRCRGW